jgi:hypothetical protein
MTTKNKSLALANNKHKQRITLFVNPSILKHARAQAVVEDLSLTSLVEKALINYLPKETIIRKSYIQVDPDP